MKTTEKKVSHTPGPWKAVEEFEGWAVVRYNKTLVFGTQYIAVEVNQGHDMGEADAKLIAAAPDLLEALIALANIAEDEDCFPTFTEKARQAIQKATL